MKKGGIRTELVILIMFLAIIGIMVLVKVLLF